MVLELAELAHDMKKPRFAATRCTRLAHSVFMLGNLLVTRLTTYSPLDFARFHTSDFENFIYTAVRWLHSVATLKAQLPRPPPKCYPPRREYRDSALQCQSAHHHIHFKSMPLRDCRAALCSPPIKPAHAQPTGSTPKKAPYWLPGVSITGRTGRDSYFQRCRPCYCAEAF